MEKRITQQTHRELSRSKCLQTGEQHHHYAKNFGQLQQAHQILVFPSSLEQIQAHHLRSMSSQSCHQQAALHQMLKQYLLHSLA
jgi:hypothetical protein